MQDFIDTVNDERLSELLEMAIKGKGSFRRFKDVLLNYPEDREKWFHFKNNRMQARAVEWLDDIYVSLIQE
jgi:hypothetical protein